MTISRAQMNRQLYQMGGIGTLPMDFGQPLQVSQPMMNPSFGPMQPMSNPMSNYGQTPLTMAGGGITRLGYQEGGMDQMMMEPQMQEQMMQPQMQEQMMQAPMQDQMMPAAGGGQPNQMEGETALLTIIQMLIEEGIDPETAKELAGRILEAFNQGGEPAVEALANQLEQEEGMQEPMMMAGGGIISIRQNYGFGKSVGKVFKSAAKAVKSIAKSPIGQIALAIAAPYAIGAMFPGFATLGGTGFLGGALRAGISSLAVQGITTGKINPKQALLAAAAGGALSGFQGAGNLSTDPGTLSAGGLGIPGADVASTTLESGLNTSAFIPQVQSGAEFASASPTDLGKTVTNVGGLPSYTDYASTPLTESQRLATQAQFGNPLERGIAQVQQTAGDVGKYISETGSNFMKDPLATVGRGISNVGQFAKENPSAAILAATAALGAFTPQQPGEPDGTYQQRKAEYDARVAEYITQYGGGAKVYSPGQSGLYAMEKAIDPFAGRSSYAADGGYITNRQNYFLGSKVSAVATPQSGGGTGGGGFMGGMLTKLIQQNPQMFKPQSTTVRQPRTGEFIDINQNGIDDRDEGMMYGGRAGYAEGSISFERKTLERKGYSDMMKNMTPKEISQLYDSVMGTFSRRFQAEGSMPMGEPRRNPAGIMELDYRAKGGFVPPIGIKEKADDIPAMLSNNEFVFTADAVRAAGGGSVNKGAERMYGLMKKLESGIA